MIINTNDIEALSKNKREIEREIRKLSTKPAKDISTHKMLTDEEKYKDIKWSHKICEELSRLLAQLNDDIINGQYDKTVLERCFTEVKTIRDRRYVSTRSKLFAIIIAAATVTSLKHALNDVSTIKERWELSTVEDKCQECTSIVSCRAERCSHKCHNMLKVATTKGLNKTIRVDKVCNKLFNHFEYLANLADLDVCDIGEELIYNIELNEHMSGKTKSNLMQKHILADKCTKCQAYVNVKDNLWVFKI